MRAPNLSNWKKLTTATMLSLLLLVGTSGSYVVHAGLLQDVAAPVGSAISHTSSFLGLDQLGGGSGDTTSFTEFKGGLAAPSTAGYDPGLTQATDAKTYAIKVTNFILGFLGFIAILVIVYGGFMYVTAAGKEDKAETGKKSITYAIIGILVILGSYAIVNTVLQAPGGSDQLHGSGSQEVASSGDPKARFHAMTAKVKTMAQDIITAWAFHFDAQADINQVNDKLSALYFGQQDIANATSSQFGDGTKSWGNGLSNEIADISNTIKDAANILAKIKSYIPSSIVDNYGLQSDLDTAITHLNQVALDGSNAAESEAQSNGCEGDALTHCSNRDYANVHKAFYDLMTTNGFSNKDTFTTDPVLAKVKCAVLGYGTDSCKGGSFNTSIDKARSDLKDMYDQVHPVTNIVDTAFGNLVDLTFLNQSILKLDYSQFDTAGCTQGSTQGCLATLVTETLKMQDKSPDDKTISPYKDLLDTVQNLNILYQQLLNIDFVDAHMSASITEGNAPLAVNFSAVGSLDPTGVTINDNQICWDLNGDGKFGDSDLCKNNGKTTAFNAKDLYAAIVTDSPTASSTASSAAVAAAGQAASGSDCVEKSAQTATCIYSQPGTYRVRVKIYSSDPTKIAAGMAEVVIKVDPPQTKINLDMDYSANGGSQTISIMKYDDTSGGIVANLNQVIVPLSAANSSDGLTFNASLSKTKDNQSLADVAAKGATIKWDFGDKSTNSVNNAVFSADPAHLTQHYKYTNTGSYTVTVEVTDQNKISDRKIFTVVVADLAPNVGINPLAARVGEEVTFDGSNSVSDNGPISGYTWTITKDGTTVFNNDGADSVIKHTFDTPGNYIANLKITNNTSTSTVAQIPFTVSSAAPVAQFNGEFPFKNQPGMLVLDGTPSYDPDGTKDEQLKYDWQIDGQPMAQIAASVGALKTDLMKLADPNNTGSVQIIKFANTGSHKVQLTVTDPHGFCSTDDSTCAQDSQPVIKDVSVDSVLDVDWNANDVPSQILKLDPTTNQLSALLNLTIVSDHGSSYAIDFGDGSTKQDALTGGGVTVNHNYNKAGAYTVKATVYDTANNSNSISRQVYIGSTSTPAPVVTLKVNGNPILDTANPIEVSRKDVVTFDASSSKNTDGTSRNLNFAWDFGDGKYSTSGQANHQFSDIGQYPIKLTATNANDVSQTAQAQLAIHVVGLTPIIRGLTAVPVGSSLTTPVQVNVKAIGADSPDSTIVKYRWWYYDPNNDSDQLGTQITTTPSATLTINTKGREGEQHTYKFAVEITDAENNVLSSNDPVKGLSPNLVPIINVVNGVNQAPTAKISVDRTNILVGDTVNFTADTSNSNGQNLKYYWDFEGTGFAGLQDQGPSVTHTFTVPAKDGVKVRLKVVNDADASSTSDPVTIFIDGKAQPPVAAFTTQVATGTKTVTFINNSRADTTSGATITNYSWDFDTNFDSDGDGIKDNDNDSNAQSPTYEYANYGVYRAKLTVTDSDGNTAQVTNFVNVSQPTQLPGHPSAQNTYSADVFTPNEGGEMLALLVSISLFAILLINLRLNKKTNARKHSTKR